MTSLRRLLGEYQDLNYEVRQALDRMDQIQAELGEHLHLEPLGHEQILIFNEATLIYKSFDPEEVVLESDRLEVEKERDQIIQFLVEHIRPDDQIYQWVEESEEASGGANPSGLRELTLEEFRSLASVFLFLELTEGAGQLQVTNHPGYVGAGEGHELVITKESPFELSRYPNRGSSSKE